MWPTTELVSWLVHLGFALTGAAWLVRDILLLRLLAIASYLVFSLFLLTTQASPSLTYLGWYALFLAINAVQATQLFYDRRLRRMSAEDRQLACEVFPALDPLAIKRLFAMARRAQVDSPHTLTRAGQRSRFVYLIAEGTADVAIAGRRVATLGRGRFVGEIGLIADRPANATVSIDPSAGTLTRLLVWRQSDLRAKLERDDLVRGAILSAIGSDLAAKLECHNVQPVTASRVDPTTSPPANIQPLDLPDRDWRTRRWFGAGRIGRRAPGELQAPQ
jgi:CRP-like cAMP-binding protein